jgi:GT2 family glycosyltransferase
MITRNRCRDALAAVQRLRELPDRPSIIVVDNGSDDGTVTALRSISDDDLTVIDLGRNAGAAGRNVGVAAARTAYVAFVDDDSGWEPDALERAVDVLDAHPRLAVLAAAVLVGDDRRLDPTCIAMAASPLPAESDLPGPPVLGFIACGAVVRRDAFLEVGGFDEHLGVGGEETPLAVEMAMAGWGLCYVDSVVARHWPSPVRDTRGRRRRVVRNDLWLVWRRRRITTVAAFTAKAAVAALEDPDARAGLSDALGGLRRVIRERRPVDADLEAALRRLD